MSAMDQATTRTTPQPPGGPLRFRADIQGLRAVAVALVVADHVLGWPHGGFVGVDVFFVISGYLITALLLRELASTGRISFRDFYVRRAKRILPAAMVVLAVTVAVGYAVWFLPRANQSALDALAAALFVENWHLVAAGADYLQAQGPESPVQHYWSLSIEEQFYALWPLLLFAGFRLLDLRHRPGRLVWFISAGIVVSLAWAAYRTSTAPTAAYFDTLARAGELLIGALAAVVAGRAAVADRLRPGLSLGGLVVILGSAVVISPSSAFPFPWVLAPVLGAAMVLLADPPRSTATALLTNPVAQRIGQWSFSIYLWHWPVVVFGLAMFGSSIEVQLALVALTVLLSAASYRWVERPVLALRPRPRYVSGWERRRGTGVLLPVTVAGVLFVVGVAQFLGPAWLRGADTTNAGPAVSAPGERPTAAELAEQVEDALSADSWPADLTPSLDGLGPEQQAEEMGTEAPGCRNTVTEIDDPLVCQDGLADAPRTALLVGDSVAMSWGPTVDAVFSGDDWQVLGLGYASCPFVDVAVAPPAEPPGFPDDCAAAREITQQFIEETEPDVLVLSAGQGYFGNFVSGSGSDGDSEAAIDEWRRGLESTLEAVTPHAGSVVVLGNPPLGIDPRECGTRLGSPEDCVRSIGRGFPDKSEAEQSAVESLQAAGADVTYVETRELFCADGRCPAFIGSVLLRTDETHLTAAAADMLAAAVREMVPARVRS
ncbi:acyltransferase family protein [Blastococcus sp. BMG 814]|uniref:Acyltransferase family protein n=1 Tax=Blastococcus carthaginiensis TaxID=3050034 RepID=A0ABT9IE37_9ACTN|nr:acyltransferase family protein [Blastococcus carthaginiensis]MDP5183854.1 acyltransferase family protein [Blastococcus carthaginiensis]